MCVEAFVPLYEDCPALKNEHCPAYNIAQPQEWEVLPIEVDFKREGGNRMVAYSLYKRTLYSCKKRLYK